jgi:sulfoxide reductase heme-binding subunit YedZ
VTSGREFWYLTRGTGIVALVLLTASVSFGIAASLRAHSERWPRFAIGRVHRNLTLLSVVFVAVHVVTTVADGYAPIGLLDGVIPFLSPYRPIWLGLGTVAFDLLLALVVTSYVRGLIGARAWRAVHWLAYVSWPVALAHSFGTGTDARAAWLVAIGVAALGAVILSVGARLVAGGGAPSARGAAALTAAVAVAITVGWYRQGPASAGWAARAGTPARLQASRRTTVSFRRASVKTILPKAPTSFTARVSGTVRDVTLAEGRVNVEILLRLAGKPGGALRVEIAGDPIGGGVSMTSSGVSFVPQTTGAVYLGAVTALEGETVGAVVHDAARDTLALTLNLSLDPAAGTASGIVIAKAQA